MTSVYGKIQNLITAANTVTGESDTTLTDAVQTLIDGYGGGGGTGDTLGESLLFTLNSYENSDITSLPMTYAFSGRTSLQSLKLPNLKSSNAYLIAGCTGLTKVAFPKLDTFSGWQIFASNASVQEIDILGPSAMQQQVFYNDYNLTVLVLRRTSVVSMANINCFNGTPFRSGGTGGTLYVPSALISSYQSASNWSTILGYANNQIKAIEGSYYETHYADGTVIS